MRGWHGENPVLAAFFDEIRRRLGMLLLCLALRDFVRERSV